MAFFGLLWPFLVLNSLLWPFHCVYCLLWENIDLIGLVSSFLAVIDPNSFDLVPFSPAFFKSCPILEFIDSNRVLDPLTHTDHGNEIFLVMTRYLDLVFRFKKKSIFSNFQCYIGSTTSKKRFYSYFLHIFTVLRQVC